MADVLEQILAARREDLNKKKRQTGFEELVGQAKKNLRPSAFLSAVHQPGRIALIAEMKAKSPSAGALRSSYDVKAIAKIYAQGGAQALSILTEGDFFGGSIEDIQVVRQVTDLPILRKDFIFDPYQVVESKAFGADAVLLIADMLEGRLLQELTECAFEYGLDPLVEVFTPDVLANVLNSKAKLIGINTRNLRTLEMAPDNIARIARLIPKDKVIVAESGIKSPADLEKFRGRRISAVLVGESLLKAEDPLQAVKDLVRAGQAEGSGL